MTYHHEINQHFNLNVRSHRLPAVTDDISHIGLNVMLLNADF